MNYHFSGRDIASNANGSMIVAASANWELFVSFDFGVTWGYFKQPPQRSFSNVVLSDSGETIVVAAMSKGDRNATLYTSFDYGCSWKKTTSSGYFTNWSTKLALSSNGSIVLATGIHSYFF